MNNMRENDENKLLLLFPNMATFLDGESQTKTTASCRGLSFVIRCIYAFQPSVKCSNISHNI